MATTSKDISHIVEFDGSNYPSWSFGIRMFLEKLRLIPVVDGNERQPTEIRADVDGEINNMEEIEAWSRDVDARTYIYSTIKLEQNASLHGCVTAHEMWTRIQTQYAEVAAENSYFLMARFFEYKYYPGQSVMTFIASIEQLAAQLRDLESSVSDVQVMAKIIMSLPPSFCTFVSAWDSVPTVDKTITHLTSRLIKEKKLTLMYNKGAVDPSDSAFFTGDVNNTRQA